MCNGVFRSIDSKFIFTSLGDHMVCMLARSKDIGFKASAVTDVEMVDNSFILICLFLIYCLFIFQGLLMEKTAMDDVKGKLIFLISFEKKLS